MGFGIQWITQTEISNTLKAVLQFDLWQKQPSNRLGLVCIHSFREMGSEN